MKKLIALLLTVVLICGLGACGETEAAPSYTEETPSYTEEPPSYIAPEDVTIELLSEMTTPEKILEHVSGFRMDYDYSGTGDANLDEGTIYRVFVKDGDYICFNHIGDYPGDVFARIFFTNDPADPMIYVENNKGKEGKELAAEDLKAELSDSFLGYQFFSDAKIVSAAEEDGNYILTVEAARDGALYFRDTLTMEAATGLVTKVFEEYFENGEVEATLEQRLTYSDTLTIDRSPKDGAVIEEKPAESDLTFSTVDINGQPVTEEILRDAKLVMVNLWEPWCGPCVGEMPDLQKLYENYKDQGLLILGVFSTTDETEEAKAILEAKGITYPILVCDSNFARYQTGYVPTTFFTDGEGRLLSTEPIVSAKDYAAWEAIVQGYLK